jgi:hypothetical protein
MFYLPINNLPNLYFSSSKYIIFNLLKFCRCCAQKEYFQKKIHHHLYVCIALSLLLILGLLRFKFRSNSETTELLNCAMICDSVRVAKPLYPGTDGVVDRVHNKQAYLAYNIDRSTKSTLHIHCVKIIKCWPTT